MRDADEHPIQSPIVELGPRTLRIGYDKILMRSTIRSVEIIHEAVPAVQEEAVKGRYLWAGPLPALAGLIAAGLGIWFAYTAFMTSEPLWLLLPVMVGALMLGFWLKQIYTPPGTKKTAFEKDRYSVAFFDIAGDVIRLHAESHASALAFFQQLSSAWNLDLQNNDRVEISQNGIENKMLRSLKAYDDEKGRRIVLYESDPQPDQNIVSQESEPVG